MPDDQLETIPRDQIENVTGGIDIGGLATSIGGIVDQFACTGGKATQIAGQIGGLVSSLMGGAR